LSTAKEDEFGDRELKLPMNFADMGMADAEEYFTQQLPKSNELSA
jgi:hypothetical protein